TGGMARGGFYRVRDVEPTEEYATVYNFEVEEDHTYVANQVVVHNCFVLPVPDSLEGIMEHAKHCALIHQSGGGCISADARVWTTFCGLEPIEVLSTARPLMAAQACLMAMAGLTMSGISTFRPPR